MAGTLTPAERAILDDLREEVAEIVDRTMLRAAQAEIDAAQARSVARMEALPPEDRTTDAMIDAAIGA